VWVHTPNRHQRIGTNGAKLLCPGRASSTDANTQKRLSNKDTQEPPPMRFFAYTPAIHSRQSNASSMCPVHTEHTE
jgi:hypothetical protein